MKLKVKEITLFGLLGALMYASKVAMQFLPNIHLIGTFIVATTLVFRKKALYPLYIYIFCEGLFGGFTAWWVPYLYVWAILWGVVMLLPKNIPQKAKPFIYAGVSGLHGFLFGTLFAPAQALLFGLDFKGMLSWIAAGLPFDIAHGVGNILCGMLIMPMTAVLSRAEKEINR